jgi:CheY-like chemotaxis protein
MKPPAEATRNRTAKEKPMRAPTEPRPPFRPRLVLAHLDAKFAGLICRRLEAMGWDVHHADSGQQVRRLAGDLDPAAVVLSTELPGESGWLTCAKLTRERPGQRVVLVTPNAAAESRRFTEFVGADSMVSQRDGAQAVVCELVGAALPTV